MEQELIARATRIHDGETRLLRVEHCDAPELAVLSATDRASVAAAVAGLLREIPPDAA